jgi:hypothetical protein
MLGMIIGHDIEKVEHFIDGVNKGMGALGSSLSEIKPSFEGDYSAVNIIKELGMTVINIVWKPVTGILRMTLRISEGIRKTTKFEFVATDKIYKQRLPIVFYQREQIYRTYNAQHSELMNTLKKCLRLEMRYFYLVDFIVTEYMLTNQRNCLAVGTDELILFEARKEKLLWRVEFGIIRKVEVFNMCTVKLSLGRKENGVDGEVLELDFTTEEAVVTVTDLIEKMRKHSTIEL